MKAIYMTVREELDTLIHEAELNNKRIARVELTYGEFRLLQDELRDHVRYPSAGAPGAILYLGIPIFVVDK